MILTSNITARAAHPYIVGNVPAVRDSSPTIYHAGEAYPGGVRDVIGDKITGCAAKYGTITKGKPEKLVRGCFSHSLAVDHDDIEVLLNHNTSQVVCSPENVFLIDKEDGLYFSAWPETRSAGYKAVLAAMAGGINGISIGGYARETATSFGVTKVLRFELMEISILTGAHLPCESETHATYTRAGALEAQRKAKAEAAEATLRY